MKTYVCTDLAGGSSVRSSGAAAFRIRCLRGRLVEIYENYSRLPRFRVFMHQRLSLSLAPFLPVLHSLSLSSSLSIHERSSATSGRTLRSPLFCPRHVEISIRDAGLSNKVGDGEIVPADFVRLAHPEVPPRLCSTFRRTTRLALPFVYAARRPCRFQRRPLLRSVYGVILTTDWFNCTLATGSEL